MCVVGTTNNENGKKVSIPSSIGKNYNIKLLEQILFLELFYFISITKENVCC